MGPKYEFTGETKKDPWSGCLLHRIRRIENGELGGWIESEANLSQEGNCWVSGEATVYDYARVSGNAQVSWCACVRDFAQVSGNAKVYDSAEVYDFAKVYGYAQVSGYAKICGEAIVRGDAQICSKTKIRDEIIGEDNSDNEQSTEVVHDFIYKVDDSDKLDAQTEYDSIDEFFNEPITNDIELDTLIICTVDTKEPLIKLQKVETDNRTEFKFIVDIIDEDGDNFIFKSVIKSRDQLNRLIQQTVEALKNYSKFGKYADDLEKNCL